MDFRIGMICPSCKKSNGFGGGRFGGPITVVNYNCGCGFFAAVLIPGDGYEIEYKAIKTESPAGK